ncbi:MAG: glycogen/starch synthase [Planctomycetes bacterium]|nr:glycogen/starch synthase [Planctomycetota bacterium]MBL7144706.1 glycogen/starch synthase [Phycisphaerae bacterium]
MKNVRSNKRTTDTIAMFNFDARGKCNFHNSKSITSTLGKDKTLFLQNSLNQTLKVIKEDSPDLCNVLLGRNIRLRISEAFEGTIYLMPHELAMNLSILDFENRSKQDRECLLIGELEQALFHLCNPHFHISQVRIHSLHFYASHRDILKSTIRELNSHSHTFGASEWLLTLSQIDNIVLLEKFWTWLGRRKTAKTILQVGSDSGMRPKSKIRAAISGDVDAFVEESYTDLEQVKKTILDYKEVFLDSGSIILVYKLDGKINKAVRLCPSVILDAMSSEAACASVYYEGVRTDVFHDHGSFITGWICRLKAYAKDQFYSLIGERLISDDFHKVNAAIDELRDRILHKGGDHESVRLLYAVLYYWHNQDKGICRSVCLKVNKILEDMLTERPLTFPSSLVNRSIFRGERARIRITTVKPRGVSRDKVRARVVWSFNGHRKKPLYMELDSKGSCYDNISFSAELPERHGWIHYSVQVSLDEGKRWEYEKSDDCSHGLLKFIPDERGHRILSFYADTFNLRLDQKMEPLRDHAGAFIYGTFDDISEQLEAIKAEGYTRIYPLGALELGWAGEAGPDPSVFSIWDGKTVRRDMGGVEGLMRLKEKADSLNMKILLDVVSHFSRANYAYAYSMPVYIVDGSGNLTRRAGWDGESDEWFDSFMVNMRDYNNIEILSALYKELAGMGFGLRIDVGHGFDTVFPVDPRASLPARLFGEVVTGGFERIDLRGTWESCAPILKISYEVQKAVPEALIVYSEQWHGNEARMIKSGTFPYNPYIKNLESIRDGQDTNGIFGINDTITYLNRVHRYCGGQTLSFFNTHDEESPPSNYQNMIWPASAFLVLSSYGPLMYHISRLPGEEAGPMRERFNAAYTECWKHWTFNRCSHPWQGEAHARQRLLTTYPLLQGFGPYLRKLYKLTDEHPALTKGTITPIQTNNGRIAAFLRSYQRQTFLCVFNFPNPHHEGQQAVAREYNFTLKDATDFTPITDIETDEAYELRERYNNAEGRTRRGKREYWSGEELLHLGFGGVLSPTSSHVYEIIYRDKSVSEEFMIPDSFMRYQRYGKQDRVRHSYIARVFTIACELNKGGFERFSDLFEMTVSWIYKYQKLGIAELSMLLAEISEDNKSMRDRIIEFLMLVAVNEKGRFGTDIQEAAVDILQSVNIGTIALVSPESRFSVSAGGVGIYTTDIADVLSELGFHIVIVTALYEWNRDWIFRSYRPKYEGHCFSVQFPTFDDQSQSIRWDAPADVVNILRARIIRHPHGKRTRIDVLYLENSKYLDKPYGGSTSEDKLRRARIFSQGALEALRCYNYYPSIIQTNEWPTWLVPAYLERWREYRDDSHFKGTQAGSIIHNPHPSYSIILDEANPVKRNYYCLVLGLAPDHHYDLAVNPDSSSGHEIDLMHTMLKPSKFVGTVSKAMKKRILDEPWVFGHARDFAEKEAAGRFFARRNGFNMAARQRFWFGTKTSILETYRPSVRHRLFLKCTRIKKTAKLRLQTDTHIQLEQDDENTNHVIFAMLHRICRQKGFELLIDWKVYIDRGRRYVRYEPWNMGGTTVLEYFMTTDTRIQYVICGRIEDSFDGRQFDTQLRRIAGLPIFKGRFAYYPEGSLSTALYRDIYLGSQYFVMPSGGEVGEPCGISQQEAHAGGTPVIAHHQDGLKRTVSDRHFGDTRHSPNGIKFIGFTGEALLDALLDAVEIYYHGRRLRYVDNKGRPKKERYSNLSFNAFHTDHRWLRLLRYYVDMYAMVLRVKLPYHIDAVRLIAETTSASDENLCIAVLRKGIRMVEAADYLTESLSCEIPSVRSAAGQMLVRLGHVLRVESRLDIEGRLRHATKSQNKTMKEAAIFYLQHMLK